MERMSAAEITVAGRELKAVLEFNGIRFREDPDGIRFAFTEQGRRWEMLCRVSRSAVIIYGIYPFAVSESAELRGAMDGANALLIRGSLFLSDGVPVIRTSADIIDEYGAYEAITRAMEYNAGAITRFWGDMQRSAK